MKTVQTFFRENYFSIVLHGLIWGALLIGPTLVEMPAKVYATVGSVHLNFVIIANVLHCFIFYFNAFYLYDLLSRKRWWIYIVSVLALVVAVNGIKGFLLTSLFSELAASDMPYRFAFFPTVFFIIVSIIYRLVLDKINYEKSKNSKKAEQLTSELRFLRSQISPHFLFNVLNNLVAMARYKSDQLETIHQILRSNPCC
jgi:sensor histidine kinase YesM